LDFGVKKLAWVDFQLGGPPEKGFLGGTGQGKTFGDFGLGVKNFPEDQGGETD